MESSGTSIKVLGQSGKVTITNGESITMEFDSIQEVDENGNIVGKTGPLSQKHSINSFATQNFEFSEVTTEQYNNVSTDVFSFNTHINDIGRMSVKTYIIREENTVSTTNESWSVSAGDLKWNILLSDWTWCTPCADGIGKYIDLDIVIKGDKEATSDGNKTFQVGNSQLDLSSEVIVDGTNVAMPDGYPKFTTKGSKQIFSFRFPKFSDNIEYDPLFRYGISGDSTDTDLGLIIGLSSAAVVILGVILYFALRKPTSRVARRFT